MEYKKGERVRHPIKDDWGLGQVLSDSNGKTVTVYFADAEEKTLALNYVQPLKVFDDEAASNILDNLKPVESSRKGKTLCKNCGQPTQFGETADPQRAALGWCNSCYKQSQRTFKDSITGETRYLDELRTIDGIRTRFTPK